ncbi:glutamine amidotransferase [Neosynechococcus sphagnicola sy1]|uniref:Glutamine amidotransferase n=1 Tax=Neosynechococcus sphagnicola sy1 TaxID=1497020 RepID=A0A098TMS2_9CYAN|nr:ergothioneine biosynthesis protein EgtC [Neosynechococcus sphagnicola]KGF72143.1 glutamine amidotransferase [Neosynechococcus sphagnicola sy1]
MCRLLGYLGVPIQLDTLLYQTEHSLVVQSYQPQEMTAGLLNADGFGIGWYHPHQDALPYTYKNILPIWSDINLPHLSRYIESGCMVANVRSATSGQAVDLSNCQPFSSDRILGVHNGFIEQFRQTLYRPIRHRLEDDAYQGIEGSTDSEHIFALLLDLMQTTGMTLEQGLQATLTLLSQMARSHPTQLSANLVLTDGQQLVASRFATRSPAPSLYWLRNQSPVANGVLIASEPLFAGAWQRVPEQTLLRVDRDLTVVVQSLKAD